MVPFNTISTKITKTKPKEWLNKRNVLLNNIWNDNDISMRTGMLFDPNFLTFMRDLLVMSSGVVDTKTIKDEQKEKKANKKASLQRIPVLPTPALATSTCTRCFRSAWHHWSKSSNAHALVPGTNFSTCSSMS